MTLRPALEADVPLLAELNRQLIADQGHDSAAGPAELAARMRHWLGGAQRVAVAEEDGVPVGYAVWREDEHDGVYLRHLFVAREHRRGGVGRRMVTELLAGWAGREIKLDVLRHNARALAFWQAMGFTAHATVLRHKPGPPGPEGATG